MDDLFKRDDIMSDKCNCFDEKLELIKEKVLEQVPEGSEDVKVEYENRTFILSANSDYSPVNPKVKFEYRKPKKGGGMAKSLTKDSVIMVADFCCFCGRKLNKNNKPADD